MLKAPFTLLLYTLLEVVKEFNKITILKRVLVVNLVQQILNIGSKCNGCIIIARKLRHRPKVNFTRALTEDYTIDVVFNS